MIRAAVRKQRSLIELSDPIVAIAAGLGLALVTGQYR